MSKLYKNNKTGCPGVCFETIANKYRAYITVFGEKIKLGYYSNLNDAINARLNAEMLYKFDNSRYGNDSKIIRFVIKDNDNLYNKAFYALIKSLFAYDYSYHFSTFAVDYVKRYLDNNSYCDDTFYHRYKNMSLPNKDILNDYLKGDTLKQIAKKYNTTVYNVRKILNNNINILKGEL